MKTLAMWILGIAAGMLSLSQPALAHEDGEDCKKPTTTIIVVRHAERAGQADSLTAEGRARAKELIHIVGEAVRAVYHSDTRRTKDTGEPVATEVRVPLVEYPAKDVDALIARIFAEREGETVLIIGHSNTVPLIIAAAGGPAIEELSEKEFDRMFVVEVPPCRKGPVKLISLQYGAESP